MRVLPGEARELQSRQGLQRRQVAVGHRGADQLEHLQPRVVAQEADRQDRAQPRHRAGAVAQVAQRGQGAQRGRVLELARLLDPHFGERGQPGERGQIHE